MSTGLVLQTQDDCPPGLLGDWAAANGFALEVVRVDRVQPPDPRGAAFAVVLGSEASVAIPEHAWVQRTVEWVRAADTAGTPVLGICFGAQVLTAALGGRVLRLPRPEIGWVQIESDDPERVVSGPWLEWHEDAIELPPLAYELARNDFGVQAFCHCRHLAVQFHPEVTARIVTSWARGGEADLRRRGIDPWALVQATGEHAPAAAQGAMRLFDGFAARAGLSSLAFRG